MAGDCIYNTHYGNNDTFDNKHLLGRKQELARDPSILDNMKGSTSTSAVTSSPYFEVIDGVLFRKKLEKGHFNYREVLDKDRQLNAIATFHQKGKRHHTLEDTYRLVAENYWWEGMYFHIRDFVLGCQECHGQKGEKEVNAEPCVSKTLASHGNNVLRKLKGQQEEGLFCDITLRTSGRSFPAHRAVLAAVSEYFQEVFAEMDAASSPQSDIDLTGFSEDHFLALLEFSYTSTLSLKMENLSEISTMARHFRMWAVVEACKDIQREQGVKGSAGSNFQRTQPSPGGHPSASLCSIHNQHDGPKTSGTSRGKRKRGWCLQEDSEEFESCRKRPMTSLEHLLDAGFKPTDPPGHSEAEPVRRPPTRSLDFKDPVENGLPCSPVRRLKLMDFKSPSSKCKTSPRSVSSPSGEGAVSPAHRQPKRVLRSRTVEPQPRRLPKVKRSQGDTGLEIPSSSSRCKQRLSFPEVACESTPVKQEPVEEEVQSPSTLEKYRLLSVLGLQRKSLLPDPVELTGWRQKKRLRKLKVSSYSLTARRNPRPAPDGALGLAACTTTAGSTGSGELACSLGNGRSSSVLRAMIKTEPPEPVSMEEMRLQREGPSDRSSRSTVPSLKPLRSSERRELRRSVRIRDAPLQGLPRLRARKVEPGTHMPKRKPVRIKREPSAFAIQAPALPTCSSHNHHQVDSSMSLRVKRPVAESHPLEVLASRASRSYSSSRAATQTKAKRNCVTAGRKGAAKHRKEGQTASRFAPLWMEARTTEGLIGRRNCSRSDSHLHSLQRTIKDEPVDPIPVCFPVTTELGKRQSKPPVKLLDPGFLFDFCRPAGGIKREEDSVDICLTRSVSSGRAGDERNDHSGSHIAGRTRGAAREAWASLRLGRKQLQAKGGAFRPLLKRSSVSSGAEGCRGAQNGPQRRTLANTGKPTVKSEQPKKLKQLLPIQSRRSRLLESICRARRRKLRGVRSHAPVTSHTCIQCRVTYRNCDSLIMHRIRHIEGKHWPCPLCSKTFFRQSNVRNHIRTHDQKLYKCRVCISAA